MIREVGRENQFLGEKMLPSGVLEGACPVLSISCCDGLASRQLCDLQLCKPFVCLPRKSVHHQTSSVRAVISEPSASDNAGDSAADFVKRAERAWMISKVGDPIWSCICFGIPLVL